MTRRFDVELALWDAHQDSHLLVIATFGVGPTGLPSIEEIALANATSNWIPFENEFEKVLIDAMTSVGRRFVKGLRYNLGPSEPLACLVASDTKPRPTALYIEPPTADERYRARLAELIESSSLASWVWRPAAGPMPSLPAVLAAP